MPASTDPSSAAVVANLPQAGGRVTIVWNEILRLLKAVLPGAITLTNTTLALTNGIPAPEGYRVAPEVLSDAYVNNIVVGLSTSGESYGTASCKDTATIVIYDIHQRIEVREQADDAWDRSNVIMAVMLATMGGWSDKAGRLCWSDLSYKGRSPLPGAWSEYSGVAIRYQCTMAPGNTLAWT